MILYDLIEQVKAQAKASKKYDMRTFQYDVHNVPHSTLLGTVEFFIYERHRSPYHRYWISCYELGTGRCLLPWAPHGSACARPQDPKKVVGYFRKVAGVEQYFPVTERSGA